MGASDIISLVLSASGLSRFHECETRFLQYAQESDEDRGLAKGDGLRRGTAAHTLLRPRWRGKDWRESIPEMALDLNPRWSPKWNLPELARQAVRLAERHEERYPTLPRAIATELQFKLRHPKRGLKLEILGYQDALVLVGPDDPEHEGLWVVETKTMSRWDRLDWLSCDPQIGTYMWAAREQGFETRGVLFDALLTTEWATERPVEDSFRRLWLPHNQALVDATLAEYEKAANRIREIRDNPALAIKSMGTACAGRYGQRCPGWDECWGDVA